MSRNAIPGIVVLALAGASLAQGQYHAKLALEDGTPLPSAPMVIPTTMSDVPRCIIQNLFGNGQIVYWVDWRSSSRYNRETPDLCQIGFSLQGYQRVDVTLHNGAVIVLKRLGDHEGGSVSMSALKAPPDARKAYEKGVAEIAKRKWAEAQKNLERAVAIYPEYAPAWSDLGEALREQSQPKEAGTAWERAIQADPKYGKPYLQLTRLAVSETRLEDAVRIAERAFEMRIIGFPGIYFYHALANYGLHRLDAAEKSARQAVELDAAHEMPHAEHLLGTVLAAKGDRRGAVEHLTKYLEAAPKAPDAEAVRKRIEELERPGP
jgi:tetratricopeptide (TPR) repeat protein